MAAKLTCGGPLPDNLLGFILRVRGTLEPCMMCLSAHGVQDHVAGQRCGQGGVDDGWLLWSPMGLCGQWVDLGDISLLELLAVSL